MKQFEKSRKPLLVYLTLTYLIMISACPTILLLCFLTSAAKASSFYDNPEQDPLPFEDTPEDLHKKWDFEVNITSFVDFRCFALLG